MDPLTEAQMLQAHEKILMRMKMAGLGIKKHVLENKISKQYKAAIKASGSTH